MITLDKTAFIYLVAAIEEPTVVATQGGQQAKLVLEPTFVLAGSRKAAIAAAGRLLDADPSPRTRIVCINMKEDDSSGY